MPVTVASLEAVLDLNKDKFDRGLKGVDGALKNFGKVAGGAVVAGGAAATAAITGIGVAAFNLENDLDAATAKIATGLGITKDAAEDFEDAMVGVFKNNFGENFDDIADTLVTVRKNMQRIDERDLQKVTEQALALRDAFGVDIVEVTRTASQAMENMGLTGQEAMDLITAGFQTGTDAQGDLLDTLNEYSEDFGRLGLTADETLGLLNRGLQAGILNTDKIGDAVNEFGINLRDPAVLDNLAEIDAGLADIVQRFQAGELGEREAFEGIISGLREIDDQIAQDQAGVLLFRSIWEDLGATAITALGDIEAGAGSVQDATDTLNEQFNTLDARIEGVFRKLQTALLPLGEILVDAVEAALPAIERFLDQITESDLPELIEAVKEFNDAFGELLEATGLVNEEFTAFDFLLNLVRTALVTITASLQGWVNIFNLVRQAVEKVSAVIDRAKDTWNGFGDTLSNIGDSLPDWLRPGSPTPLEIGLRGIASSLNRIPDLNQGLGGLAAVAGAGGSTSNVTVNIGGVSATTQTNGNANAEAIRMTLQLLRSQLEAAG